jgi:hypothetical protein
MRYAIGDGLCHYLGAIPARPSPAETDSLVLTPALPLRPNEDRLPMCRPLAVLPALGVEFELR